MTEKNRGEMNAKYGGNVIDVTGTSVYFVIITHYRRSGIKVPNVLEGD